ncbi:MAG: hypothetical protein KME45_18815 [Stenomitos rutilans HA7619-LM2]|jgi:hypothetical protein|nr:hypothetical protein [Stenomitos rutilans HA7619-LM2]
MPEALDLPTLFAQLQTRYPASGLLTELVQIHADRFVVRAIVQLGNMTLATSLAAATTVEQAEDQARLRVLVLLGIALNVQPVPIASTTLPFPYANAPATPRTPADIALPTFNEVAPPSDVPPIALAGNEATIPPPPTFPPLTIEPALLSHLPNASFSTPAVDPSVPTLDRSERALEGWQTPLEDVPDDEAPFDRDDSPDDETPYDQAPYDEAPYDEAEPFVEEEPDRALTTDEPLPAAEAPVSRSKPRKPTANKETPADAGTSESASRDLSSLISQIGVEIDRIGWSKRQGSTYLQKTYGKKTRSELTDDELEDFLSYLNTQPSAGQE